MDIIEKYEELIEKRKWDEALPIIKEIIDRNDSIDTSWFNYGVCLDELGQHSSAADAFIKSHELNVQDSGVHYRIYRSLFLAKDFDQLYEFIDYLCATFTNSHEEIRQSEEYIELCKHKKINDILEKYNDKSA
ncbi:MAG: tetratricopeptide repeat protein [Gammaproteobacteria bacterium]|nr:tetratricopeptide repeat protein [Gammaproteobacteria bacterium]